MLPILFFKGYQGHFILVSDGFNLAIQDVSHVLADQVGGVEELHLDVLVALQMRVLSDSYP